MLSKKQQFLRKQLLIKIHTSSMYKTLKMLDIWEEWLEIRYGVESCKTLSIDELNKVCDELIKGKVYEDTKPDVRGRRMLKNDNITSHQLTYMKALWKEKSNNKDELSLLRFTSRVTGIQRMYLEQVSSIEATNVISVLEKKL